MEYTERLNLKKPQYTDDADIQDLNDNFDSIDKLEEITELTIPITGWTTNTDSGGKTYYSKSFTVTGMTANSNPITSVKVDDTISVDTVKTARKCFGYFFAYECAANTYTLFTLKVPTVQFTMILKGAKV